MAIVDDGYRSGLRGLDEEVSTEVARAEPPRAVPLGFHGQHLADP